MQLFSRIEGSGRPLLIIHGFLGLSDNWKTLSGQYAAAGFEVHALDLRNHGRSPHSEIFTYDAMAGDIDEYCREHQLEGVSIIGHSMGGKAAMFFAVSHSAMMDKLVVADIGPKYYPHHHEDILAGLNAVDFNQNPDRKDVDAILLKYIPDVGTRQFLMKSLYWKEPGRLAFRFNLEAFDNTIDTVGEALPETVVYHKPTRFVRGSKSGYIAEEDIPGIKRQFPFAEFVTISNAGHWVHAENPSEFFEKTISFLK